MDERGQVRAGEAGLVKGVQGDGSHCGVVGVRLACVG
jgi:hypothetical protein